MFGFHGVEMVSVVYFLIRCVSEGVSYRHIRSPPPPEPLSCSEFSHDPQLFDLVKGGHL